MCVAACSSTQEDSPAPDPGAAGQEGLATAGASSAGSSGEAGEAEQAGAGRGGAEVGAGGTQTGSAAGSAGRAGQAGADQPTPLLDSIVLGNDASEAAHKYQNGNTLHGPGHLGQTFRRVAPGAPLSFELKVDPKKQTYLTLRLHCADVAGDAIWLLDDKGARIGDYGAGKFLNELDNGPSTSTRPNRFLYTTYLLPLAMTQGKKVATLRLGGTAPPNFYAPNVDDRLPPLKGPLRPIYSAYTHTEGAFVPPAGELQDPLLPAHARAPADLPGIAE
jgi:hypothetical protein